MLEHALSADEFSAYKNLLGKWEAPQREECDHRARLDGIDQERQALKSLLTDALCGSVNVFQQRSTRSGS